MRLFLAFSCVNLYGAVDSPRKSDKDDQVSEFWDAGDMGCGELVIELRFRFQPMKPGQILKLIARDPGAPEDLPAWCRMTGHTMVGFEHPVYWIRRRE